ncbi:MAG TPA: endonuclease V [Deltaproteobacteria bacterium]|nr:endonuclease V [Deltaproteobacteria bacterium]
MIVATDVLYDEEQHTGLAAAVAFGGWGDEVAQREWTHLVQDIEPYVPGSFYKRELPCLLALLAPVLEQLSVVLVDGHAWLAADRPGLGHHLWEALDQQIPVIGVAKARFYGGYAQEVLRGRSKKPLYVTAAGMDPASAVVHLLQMHGPYRVPTLLKRVDKLTRQRVEAAGSSP